MVGGAPHHSSHCCMHSYSCQVLRRITGKFHVGVYIFMNNNKVHQEWAVLIITLAIVVKCCVELQVKIMLKYLFLLKTDKLVNSIAYHTSESAMHIHSGGFKKSQNN